MKHKNILIILIIIIIILLYLLLKKNYSEGFGIQDYDLPKIVWSYWDSDTLPEQIQLIYDNNKKQLSNWDYRLVTNSNKKDYIGDDDIKKDLSPQHYADWLRLYLLKKYGGVWMDISIIVNYTFDDLWNKSFIKKSELTGFNMSNLENNSVNIPVIENWFIMAPKNSEIISLWYEEYTKAIEMGFKSYKMEQISNGVNFQNIFGNNEDEVYLTQHGCLQVVLQKRLNREPNIFINLASETMFKIQSDCEWNNKCLQEKINNTSYSKKIPYIKLRGVDREHLNLATFFQS